jgi:gliding motility-associated-like protein
MPVASFFSDNLEGCQPYDSKFINTSIHSSTFLYETWNFGDNESSSQNDPLHVFTEPGLFDVSLEVITAEGCKDSISTSTYILVHPKPNALFRLTPHQIDIINPEVDITNVTSGLETSEYIVSPPGASLVGFDHSYVFDDTITYNITQFIATEFGCMDTISHSIKVEPVYNFYIPTGFTPNDDGINETWGPDGEGIKSYEMWVMNRWSEPLYFTRNLDEKWDGRYKGKKVQQGVYTYRIESWDVLGEPHEYFGKFTLSR